MSADLMTAAQVTHEMTQRIECLTLPERLQLAAALFEEREPRLAFAFAHKVVDEIGLSIGLCRTPIPTVAPKEGGAGSDGGEPRMPAPPHGGRT